MRLWLHISTRVPHLQRTTLGSRFRAPEGKPWARKLEIALPIAGVIAGVLLILGPFLATLVRSLLYWDVAGAALSLENFGALFGDPRFYQAVGNTILCGAGA